MPTDTLCKQSATADFFALHRTQGKKFVSNMPPIIRTDYKYPGTPQYVGAGTTGINMGATTAPYTIDSDVDFYFRYMAIDPNSSTPTAKVELLKNGQSLGLYSQIANPQDSPVWRLGDTHQIRAVSPGVTYVQFEYNQRGSLWGHTVSDRVGQTEIFECGSLTKPAAFSHTCGGQCPPGQIKCGDCCLDCKDMAARIDTVAARIDTVGARL